MPNGAWHGRHPEYDRWRRQIVNGNVALGGRALLALLPMLGPTELTTGSGMAAFARGACVVFKGTACDVEDQPQRYFTAEEVMHITLFVCAPHLPLGEVPHDATITITRRPR